MVYDMAYVGVILKFYSAANLVVSETTLETATFKMPLSTEVEKVYDVTYGFFAYDSIKLKYLTWTA